MACNAASGIEFDLRRRFELLDTLLPAGAAAYR
jgi:hypothetical protein